MPNWNTETILTIFVTLAGIAMLVQAIILLALFLVLRKATKSMNETIAELRDSVVPVLHTSRDILDRIAPKVEPLASDLVRTAGHIKTASANLAEISDKLRAQTAEVQVSAAEVVERVRRQTGRIDGMVTGVLDAADRAGNLLQTAVSVPARQLSGALAALKAIIESLRASDHPADPDRRYNRSSRDEDRFI
jgi:uncharacterized protein YoxC